MTPMAMEQLLLRALSIVLIDLLLAGDNALIIAMAVRSLPARQRRMATLLGAGGAVALRIGLTTLAAQMLMIRYVQLAGGLLILWIAIRLLLEAGNPPESTPSPKRVWQAIWYIVAADVTMSADNILAVAGAAKGHLGLIIFGLCLSIPFVIFSAGLLSRMMDRYPALIYAGGAILGRVAGEMILTDPFTLSLWRPSRLAGYMIEGSLALVILAVGWGINRYRKRKA